MIYPSSVPCDGHGLHLVQVAVQQMEGSHVRPPPANTSLGSQTEIHGSATMPGTWKHQAGRSGGSVVAQSPWGSSAHSPGRRVGPQLAPWSWGWHCGAGTVGLALWGWHCGAATAAGLQGGGSPEHCYYSYCRAKGNRQRCLKIDCSSNSSSLFGNIRSMMSAC